MLTNDVAVKIIIAASKCCPDADVSKLRDAILKVLEPYDIIQKERSLVSNDIPERAMMYLAIKKMDGLSRKTIQNYKLHLERFSRYMPKQVNAITEIDMRLYFATLMKQFNLKMTTISTEISIMKSFFSWLHEEDIVKHNPMVHIKTPKIPKRLRHALSDEEVELLRQACRTLREKAILEFLVSTGCRLSEVVGVSLSDIKWENMSLHVIGKGDKERIVYFNVKAKILLEKYIASRKDKNPALFVSSKRPYGRLGGRSIEKELKRIAGRIEFNKSVYPHLMRHSFATHEISSGMSLQTLQHILGHSSPSTTLVYAELNEENIQHEYRKIS